MKFTTAQILWWLRHGEPPHEACERPSDAEVAEHLASLSTDLTLQKGEITQLRDEIAELRAAPSEVSGE